LQRKREDHKHVKKPITHPVRETKTALFPAATFPPGHEKSPRDLLRGLFHAAVNDGLNVSA